LRKTWLIAAIVVIASNASAKKAVVAADATDSTLVAIPAKEAALVLFTTAATQCKLDANSNLAAVRCMLSERYNTAPKLRDQLLAIYNDTGDIFAPAEASVMDGGYRGQIKLEPIDPGARPKHLAWVIAALRDYDLFFDQLGKATQTDLRRDDRPAPEPINYRWRNLFVRFVQSIKKKTPAAYAMPWTVTYNVEGSLHRSADAVRETLFHEIFHMNDFAHHTWSATSLRTDYDAILKACEKAKNKTACYAPFAPGTTKVRGGTYYAFTQNNGDAVNEYGAELALRYYVEQRQMLRAKKMRSKAFKCGPVENARAWTSLVNEFFGGRDLVPPCT
jgi:hypothetical protein